MKFNINKSIEILQRTPSVLEEMLSGISPEWYSINEGPETFSPYDVVGHLIHGEKTDWIPRMEIILSESMNAFTPFDRFAHVVESRGKTLEQLLDEFKKLRNKNLKILKAKNITEDTLKKKGRHPVLGEVTLRNLLSTWVAHDLTHIAQITRVMAKQYKADVGPWIEYISLLKK